MVNVIIFYLYVNVSTQFVFFTRKKEKKSETVNSICRRKAKSYVMENCLCTILRNPCYWFSIVVAVSLASGGVPLLSRNPSKLESFFFLEGQNREKRPYLQKGTGVRLINKKRNFAGRGRECHIFLFFFSVCARDCKSYIICQRASRVPLTTAAKTSLITLRRSN